MMNGKKPQAPEVLHVESIDHFVQILSAWHQGKVKVLQHMLTIPPGTEVSFNDKPAQKLDGDFHQGFIVGLSLALMEMDTLPFVFEATEPSPPSDESPKTH